MRYIGAPLSDEKALRNFHHVLRLSQQTEPRSLYRVIEVTSENGSVQCAGFVRLKKVEQSQAALIGVMLQAEFEGQGLAYLAQKRLMSEAIQIGFCEVFTAYCAVNNERAHRLYQRLGFHKVRQLLYNDQQSIQWQRGINDNKTR